MGFLNLVDRYKNHVLGPAIDARMRAAGEAGLAEARSLCPVDTGQLQASIGYTYDQNTKLLTLYADKYYAAFIELGYRSRSGRIMPARPFLRPALAAMGRTWGGKTEVQFAMLAPQYHARTLAHTKGRIGRATVRLGHRPISPT